MFVEVNGSIWERKQFRELLFQLVAETHKDLPQMSNTIGKRNLLRLNLEIEKRNLENNRNEASPNSDVELKFRTDVNRNSLVEAPIDFNPEDICEVTTTEITERKTKKKNSAIHTIRNLVRATVIPSNGSDSAITSPTTHESKENNIEKTETNDHVTELVKKDKNKKKRVSGVLRDKKIRKKRNRRGGAIQNEGAPMWSPLGSCSWKSAGGRKVNLDEIKINHLCEAERNTLKKLAVMGIRDHGLESHLTIPKEHHAVARRRWKQILTLRKKGKGDPADKGVTKPLNPIFSVDLYQVIENDKAAEKSHQAAMTKLDMAGDDESTNGDERKNTDLHNDMPTQNFYERRNSDPVVLESTVFHFNSKEDFDETDVSDYMLNALRTIDTLKEEDEEDIMQHKRKSRLIEALTLSSTSASSMCILNREAEFKPPSPQVPKVIVQCADYITKYALNTIGIFRTGGSKKRVRQMKEDFDNGYSCVITEDSNPQDVAALFKDFLRSLPEPLLTRELYPTFLATTKLDTDQMTLNCVKHLIWLLPVPNRDTLDVALKCLRKVADNSKDTCDGDENLVPGNKMDAQNLATLMAPNVLHKCKGLKASQGYQVDEKMNPEDNKASIEVLETMITHQSNLFKIPASVHHEILLRLLEEDPETVDYILRKKSTRTSLVAEITSLDGEMPLEPILTGRRPSSAGPKTKYSHEEVAFYKSNSFNQGPYKPFIRKRKESTGSRPSSTRSDPPDRNSMRKSGVGTPPGRQQRKISRGVADVEEVEKRNSSSPRDSGVVVTATTPPFQRNSLRASFESRTTKLGDNKYSPSASPATKPAIIRRQGSRDRDSRDSAYDSGLYGIFPNRRSGTASFHLTDDSLNTEETDNDSHFFNEQSLKSKNVYLTDVLETPSFTMDVQPNVVRRKISLPAFPIQERASIHFKCKSPSVDDENKLRGVSSSDKTTQLSSSDLNDDDDDSNWPDWELHARGSSFPSQETIL